MTDKDAYSDQWPHVVSRTEGNRTYFEPVTAVVAMVSERYEKAGFKFAEDVTKDGPYTGVFWNLDDLEHGIREGDTVTATLTMNKGQRRTFYDVTHIVPVEPQGFPPESTDSPREPLGARGPYVDPKNRSIERQVAFKGVVDVLCAKIGIGMPPEDYTQEMEGFQTMSRVLWTGAAPLTPTSVNTPEPGSDEGPEQAAPDDEAPW